MKLPPVSPTDTRQDVIREAEQCLLEFLKASGLITPQGMESSLSTLTYQCKKENIRQQRRLI